MRDQQVRNLEPDSELTPTASLRNDKPVSTVASEQIQANKAHNEACVKLAAEVLIESPAARAVAAKFLNIAKQAGVELNVDKQAIEEVAAQVAESISSHAKKPYDWQRNKEYLRDCHFFKAIFDAGLSTDLKTNSVLPLVERRLEIDEEVNRACRTVPGSFIAPVNFDSGDAHQILKKLMDVDLKEGGGGDHAKVFEVVKKIRDLHLPIAATEKGILEELQKFLFESRDDRGWGRTHHAVLLSLIETGYFQDMPKSDQKTFKETVLDKLNQSVPEGSTDTRARMMNYRVQCAEIVALFAKMNVLEADEIPKVRDALNTTIEGFERDKGRLGEFWNSRVFQTLAETKLFTVGELEKAIDPLVTIQAYGFKWVTREASYEALAYLAASEQMTNCDAGEKFRVLKTLLAHATRELDKYEEFPEYLNRGIVKGAAKGFYFMPV